MAIRFRFQSVTSAGGDEVPLVQSGVTCVVGANNAGKSQLLKDLVAWAQRTSLASMTVLRSAEQLIEAGDSEEVALWLERHALPAGYHSTPPMYMFLPSQNQVSSEDFRRFLQTAA